MFSYWLVSRRGCNESPGIFSTFKLLKMLTKKIPECFVIATTIVGRTNYVVDSITTGKTKMVELKPKLEEAIAFLTRKLAEEYLKNCSNKHMRKFVIVRKDLLPETFGTMKEDLPFNKLQQRLQLHEKVGKFS